MATSTLIQNLDTTFTDGTSYGTALSDRRQVETFVANAPISAGQWVALDFTAALSDGDKSIKVVPADANAGAGAGIASTASKVVGVALATASSGGKVDVVVGGIAEASVTEGGAGINVGASLVVSTTAGVAEIYAAASLFPICGVLVDTLAPGAGTATRTVYVVPNFR